MKECFKKIAIYSRKSKFTGQGESCENQIELCRQYIALHLAKDTDIAVYEDEGFSGKNTKRPQFIRMLTAARMGELSAIVCYRLDRISRNIGDFAKLMEELEGYGVAFFSIKEQFDTASPLGRAMMYIASVFSQLERETIAERIRDNMLELSKTGRWLGGTTPTGYTSQKVETVLSDGKKKHLYQLEQLPQEMEKVTLIFKAYLTLGSLTKVETYLLQHGVKTKNGKSFTRCAIGAILTNPVYAVGDRDTYHYFKEQGATLCLPPDAFDGSRGVMAYNKTLQKQGKAHIKREYSQWMISIGEHEAVVSGGDWVKVQTMLHRHPAYSHRQPKTDYALLSGVLYCGHCQSYLRPKKGRQKKDGSYSFSYLCEQKEKSKQVCCRMKNLQGSWADKLVCDAIKGLQSSPALLPPLLRKEAVLWEDSPLTLLQKNIVHNDKRIAALVAAIGQQETPAVSYLLEEITSLHRENHELSAQVKALSAAQEDTAVSHTELHEKALCLLDFGQCFSLLSTSKKQWVVRELLEKAVWDGEKLHIHLK